MKKLMSLFLAVLLSLQMIPCTALAADTKEYCIADPFQDSTPMEITRNNAPIRTGPGEKYDVMVRCPKGAMIRTEGSRFNRYFHRWYKVDIGKKTCYIYEKNVKKHTHSFEHYELDGISYRVCDCGKIYMRMSPEAESLLVSKATKISRMGMGTAVLSMPPALATTSGLTVGGYTATAAKLAFSDGASPVMDVVAIVVILIGSYVASTQTLPAVDTVDEVLEAVMKLPGNVCSEFSTRKVSRVDGTLKFVDNICMDILSSYIYVLQGGDVYSPYESTAKAVASLHPGGCFSEIDKDKVGYYHHYHLGKLDKNGRHKNVTGGHIFFGIGAYSGCIPS